jgi:hypothetical protein
MKLTNYKTGLLRQLNVDCVQIVQSPTTKSTKNILLISSVECGIAKWCNFKAISDLRFFIFNQQLTLASGSMRNTATSYTFIKLREDWKAHFRFYSTVSLEGDSMVSSYAKINLLTLHLFHHNLN